MNRALQIAGANTYSESEKQRRIFLVATLINRHIQRMLDQTIIARGYLFYPIVGRYYREWLGDEYGGVEVLRSIARETAMFFVNNDHRVDTFDTGIRVYIRKKERK